MTSANDLKEKVINHLGKIKLEGLSMLDISNYVGIVKQLCEMEKPSYADMIANMSQYCCGGTYKSAPIEEATE